MLLLIIGILLVIAGLIIVVTENSIIPISIRALIFGWITAISGAILMLLWAIKIFPGK